MKSYKLICYDQFYYLSRISKPLVTPATKINTSGISKTIYLPGLNGLRAIAALAVVISHTTLGLDEFGLNNKLFGTGINDKAKGLALAGNGVTIFFTLSGFLITYLLLKEKQISRLKIKDFYIRRILRIWPLYYLYFLVCMFTALIFGISFESSAVPFYIFLAANIPFILGKALPFLSHYWSLGVEEQFYLFFPQIARLPNKRLFKIVLLLIAFLLSLKFIFWIADRNYGIKIPLLAISVTRLHVMLIGVAAAILYFNENKKFLSVATHKVTQLLSWGGLVVMALDKFHFASVIDNELVSVLSVFLIIGQVTRKNNIINLENKVCDFTGKISYGIYVIHPILIFYYAKLLGKFSSDSFLNYVLIYFLVISTTILIAYLSYEFYEKRFLKLKEKFTTIKTANIKQHS
jgi:peptidoglycan/LPS O-acetylase OafA/YrhL